jgi:hypothetical protein
MKMYMLKFFLPNKTFSYGCMVYLSYEEAYTAGMKCLMLLEENSNFEVIKLEEVTK